MFSSRVFSYKTLSVFKSKGAQCFSQSSTCGKWLKFHFSKRWLLFPLTGIVGVSCYKHNRGKVAQTVLCDGHISGDDRKQLQVVRDIIQKVKDEHGSPGVVVSVSVDGKTVWTEGFGYANLESRTKCDGHSVMRIASISKSMTMAIVAKLWEEGKLDLEKPVNEYVKEWPEKMFNDQKMTITTRQLVSHLAGIRHYDKNCGETTVPRGNKDAKNESKKETKDKVSEERQNSKKDTQSGHKDHEFKEFHLKRNFSSVATALDMFKHDRLCSQPGTKFLYTSHGWTLVSAVAEAAAGKKFPVLAKQLFRELGLQETYLDLHDPLIYNRASYYLKNKQGKIQNAPYVDNSYKWAGGGFLSTATDLVKFGNAMLYSYQYPESHNSLSANGITDKKQENTVSSLQQSENETGSQVTKPRPADTVGIGHNAKSGKNANVIDKDTFKQTVDDGEENSTQLKPGYLKASTMRMIWSPVDLTQCGWDVDGGSYGMGWGVMPDINRYGYGKQRPFYVSHTGGAIGCSSVLLIMPTGDNNGAVANANNKADASVPAIVIPPKGIVVAIIANMQSINLNPAALEIANTLVQGS